MAALLAATNARSGTVPSSSFVADALCVHSGWHYTSHRPTQHARPEYVLWGRGYWRTWKTAGNGEAAWNEVNSYGGGLQFTLGTWNHAARWSGGSVPYASSNAAIAQLPAATQILAAFFVVRHQGNWNDWPNTARACGLR